MLSRFFRKNGGENGLRGNFFAAPKICTAWDKINSQIFKNLEPGKKEKNTLYNIINI